jgi:hypothetical protein
MKEDPSQQTLIGMERGWAFLSQLLNRRIDTVDASIGCGDQIGLLICGKFHISS